MYSNSRVFGFTLIEILVVVSIIAILSAVLYASFGDARVEAQNTALQSELRELQLAIELYRSQNDEFPAPGNQAGFTQCGQQGGGNAEVASSEGCANPGANIYNPYIQGLVPDYIAELPRFDDWQNPDCNFVYEVDDASSPGWYKLTAFRCLAGAEDASEGVSVSSEFSRCPDSCGTCAGNTMNSTFYNDAVFYETYAIYSLGGQCE